MSRGREAVPLPFFQCVVAYIALLYGMVKRFLCLEVGVCGVLSPRLVCGAGREAVGLRKVPSHSDGDSGVTQPKKNCLKCCICRYELQLRLSLRHSGVTLS
ncbi:hypothetical protein, unlikely [Trypanosoma brucei gambiense DAL972]|uniref:Uncharacterized protein n=1 Tax=Trypanosoma brucei gambiense (strain MHOM/CI/86/DAL972) TaxID=679716 RepID=D0A3V5_TRYB9|nr:hypothetical protein, unlikely [Trypanosoma brucei gambiense DAL972]CBH15949.1 hypothetical protein, unlikely [Trypanosoma brucei gambiense DAL972]|eukprot:XP_011778213.1 hypothetical protein, unlikely [Trypanosoma brucei gambiense DAL972]